MTRRSVLFSPGDQAELLRKAPNTGADVVVFDLEDSVVPAAKDAARESVSSVLGEIQPACERCVRINPIGAGGDDDLAAILDRSEAIDSIMLPKVSSPDDVATLRAHLVEHAATVPILALLETASGVLAASEIAAETGVEALLLGAEDLSADIGATRTEHGEEISYARQRTVLAASKANIDAIDTLVTDFEDGDHLRADTKRAVQFGFDGKMAIHPAQVSVINESFTPDDEEINWARKVLNERDRADQNGRGVFAVDGEMIDAPLIAQAEQILERAEIAAEEDS